MAEPQREAEDDDEEDSDEVGPANGLNGTTERAERVKPGRRTSLHQVYEMQRDAFLISKKLAGTLTAPVDSSEKLSNDDLARLSSAFSSVSGVWTKLQDTKREIRGKGKVMPVPAKQPTPKRTSFDIDEQPATP